LNGDGDAVATASTSLEPGAFAAPLAIAPPAVLEPGDYRLRVSVRGKAGLGSTETLSLSLDAAPLGTGVMFLRRGASTGTQEVGTADRRFRRTERLIVETPLGIGNEASARLLGRTGTAIAIPVAASIREAA